MIRFSRMLRDENGVTALEYALIAALVAIAIILAVSNAGHNASKVFETVATSL